MYKYKTQNVKDLMYQSSKIEEFYKNIMKQQEIVFLKNWKEGVL